MLQAWVNTNLPSVGNCYELPGSSLTLSEPTVTPVGTLSAKIGAWGGFALNPNTSTLYSAANGGHSDYSGNETNSIALDVSSPAWTMPRQPTANASVTTAADRYLDGNPASAHGYYTQVFDSHGGDSRVIRFGGGSRWFDGQIIQATDAYNTATATWSALANITGLLASFENPAICRDPRNGNVYVAGSPSQWVMAKWTKSTNTWSDVRSAATTELTFAAVRTASAWDSTRNRIFFIGGGNAVKHVYTPDTNTDATITLSGAAAAAVGGLFDAGLVYIPNGDFFLARDGGSTGGTFYKITPTGVCTIFATTGGSGIPTASGNHIYTRLVYVPALQSCALLPNYANNLWFIRVEVLGPTITLQPSSTIKKIGSTATFNVSATGAISYQWKRQQGGAFSNVSGGSGGTSASYTTATLTASDSGGYICEITNAEDTVSTIVASLIVARARRPAEAQPGRFAKLLPLQPIQSKTKFTLTQNELFGASLLRTIVGEIGVFSLAAIVANLKRQSLISAALSSFSLSAKPANLNKQYSAAANVSAFVLAAQIASLRASRNVAANVSAFALSGQAASLKRNLRSVNAVGLFALSGINAGLSRSTVGVAQVASFAVVGQDAAFRNSQLLLSALASFGVSGIAAGLFKNVRLIANISAFALAGQSAGLRASRRVTAAPGAFTLSAQAVGLLSSRSVGIQLAPFVLGAQAAGLRRNARNVAELATFALSAKDALLTKLANGAFNFAGFALAAKDVQFLLSQKIVSAASSFLISGQAANLNRNRLSVQGVGAFSLSAKDVTLTRLTGQAFLPTSFALTGKDTNFLLNQALASGFSSFAVGAQVILLHKLSKLELSLGSFAVSGIDAAFIKNAGTSFEASAFDLSGKNVALLINKKAQTASCVVLGIYADLRYQASYIRSDERTYIVAGESRLYLVNAENRIQVIDSENRKNLVQ